MYLGTQKALFPAAAWYASAKFLGIMERRCRKYSSVKNGEGMVSLQMGEKNLFMYFFRKYQKKKTE